MWMLYASLSALFAAVTAILAKIGVKNVDSNLATAVRTVVILIFAWSIVFIQGNTKNLSSIPKFPLLFLILSGLSTGLSWIFYFKALQLGQVSKVVPIDRMSLVVTIIFSVIFLKEKVGWATWLGAVLMTLGAYFISFR